MFPRACASCCVLVLAVTIIAADEKASAAAQQYQALEKELQEKLRETKAEERQELLQQYAGKFLALAENHPKDATAFAALHMVLRLNWSAPADMTNPVAKAVAQLERDHLTDARMSKVAPLLVLVGTVQSNHLLQLVLDKHPDRKVQARSCKAALQIRQQVAELTREIKNDEEVRKELEKQRGKAFVERLLKEETKNREEITALEKLLQGRLADVFPDLSIGKVVPEAESQNLEGNKVKLSDLRGKVVVLDFWATWCPPCRAMIPHQRELVERLKDKPFVLVSISADARKETLVEFLKREPMPWTHWWNGDEGGMLEDWQVQAFPTIYVLDTKGVIRYKNVRGKHLDEAVDQLLKEWEEAAKKDSK